MGTAEPVKRVYIEGAARRNPGTPEDKRAVAVGIWQIYEADFTESSYGYRPGRTPHQALDQLGRTIQQRKVNYVVEAEIKGFFDHLNQKWLMSF